MISRRNFLRITGAAAAGGLVPAGLARTVWAAEGSGPETLTARLGYIPIVESAPLVIAKEKGFFAKHGMPGVDSERQSGLLDPLLVRRRGGGPGQGHRSARRAASRDGAGHA